MPKEPTIVDQKVVIPQTRELNNYGDLIFTDGEGHQHKIGNKRPQLFENIIEGVAVELYYAVYMDKKYICGAKLVGDSLPEAKKPAPELPQHQEAIRKATEPNISDSELMKLRSMALAYSKDLACAHIAVGSEMKSTDIVNVAVIFASYIANGAMIVKEP